MVVFVVEAKEKENLPFHFLSFLSVMVRAEAFAAPVQPCTAGQVCTAQLQGLRSRRPGAALGHASVTAWQLHGRPRLPALTPQWAPCPETPSSVTSDADSVSSASSCARCWMARLQLSSVEFSRWQLSARARVCVLRRLNAHTADFSLCAEGSGTVTGTGPGRPGGHGPLLGGLVRNTLEKGEPAPEGGEEWEPEENEMKESFRCGHSLVAF